VSRYLRHKAVRAFTVRMSPDSHGMARVAAAREGKSLSRWADDILDEAAREAHEQWFRHELEKREGGSMKCGQDIDYVASCILSHDHEGECLGGLAEHQHLTKLRVALEAADASAEAAQHHDCSRHIALGPQGEPNECALCEALAAYRAARGEKGSG